jgi:hypothetical protein
MKKVLLILFLAFSLIFPQNLNAQTLSCMSYSEFRQDMTKRDFELERFFLDEQDTMFELYSKASGGWVLIAVGYDMFKRKAACIIKQGPFIQSVPQKSF